MERLDTACCLDIMLVFEHVDTSFTLSLFPVNVLRNFARLQVSHLFSSFLRPDLCGFRLEAVLRSE